MIVRDQKVKNIVFCNRLYTKTGAIHACLFLCLPFVIFLTSCTSTAIYQDPDFNPPVYWGYHTVEGGDTLYSIAWRYGRDFKELAEINRIPAPYTIKAGQRISLAVPDGYVAGNTYKSPKLTSNANHNQQPANKSPEKKVVYKNKQRPPSTSNRALPKQVSGWGWPHYGPIIDTYSVTGDINKGVDIAGKIGDPVVAAASGEVVYAGSGLLGYGKLVIVNHSETYLSAYAHNNKILVKEGDHVRLGQQIAELGESGTKRPMLHFEIRKNGKPVNPLIYLPKKNK